MAKERETIEILVKYGGCHAAEEYCKLHDAEQEFSALGQPQHPYRSADNLVEMVEQALATRTQRREARSLESTVTTAPQENLMMKDYLYLTGRIIGNGLLGLGKFLLYPLLPKKLQDRLDPSPSSTKARIETFYKLAIDGAMIATTLYLLPPGLPTIFGKLASMVYGATIFSSRLVEEVFGERLTGFLPLEIIYYTAKGISYAAQSITTGIKEVARKEIEAYKKQKLLPPKRDA